MNKSVETKDLDRNSLVNNLLKQIEAKDRQMEQLNQTIANLTETINEMKRKLFGISSEKSSKVLSIDGQLSLFEQLDVEEPHQRPEIITVSSHQKKKPRATHDELAKNIPVRTIDLTLDGDNLNCPYCNTLMEEIGSKVVREEIHITPAKVERIQYVQHSYVCPQCRNDGESTIEKAPVPAPLIPHSMASASAVSYLMYQKCINCLPFYRQEKDWAHLRRYMFEAIPKKKGNEAQTSPASIGLAYCDQLFQIEKTLKDLSPEERQVQRLELERPVLDAFWKWILSGNG